MSVQSRCSSSSNANAPPRQHSTARHGLPPELIAEIAQAIPIAHCFISYKSYLFTPLRPFIHPRYHAARQMIQYQIELNQRRAELSNTTTELYKQLIQLYKRLSQLTAQGQPVNGGEAAEIATRIGELHRQLGPLNAEIEEKKEKCHEFERAWKRSKQNGGIGKEEIDKFWNKNTNTCCQIV